MYCGTASVFNILSILTALRNPDGTLKSLRNLRAEVRLFANIAVLACC